LERKLITIQKNADGVKETLLTRFAQKARKAVGLKGDVSILLTSNREMRQLNRCFRGKDKPTDVISFPAMEEVFQEFAGDLAISVDIAAANAKHFGHSTQDEIRVLILHGLLHLSGYDHEKDKGEMARKEQRLRSKLGLPSTLIARTTLMNKDETLKKSVPKTRTKRAVKTRSAR
jgi:probable rRNA maturation factor